MWMNRSITINNLNDFENDVDLISRRNSLGAESSITGISSIGTCNRFKKRYDGSKVRRLDFTGRVVIVTGAGRGIGKSIAIMYARRGAKVVVNDIGCSLDGIGVNQNKADDVVLKIKSFGGEAVASYDSVIDSEKIISKTLSNYGRIDILICNAGIMCEDSFETTKYEDWSKMMTIHFHSTCSLIARCWKSFLKQGYGRILISSTDEALARPTLHVPYCTSKTALLGYVHAVAEQGQPLGILINSFSPIAITKNNQHELETISNLTKYRLHPKKIAPLVACLTHESNKESGGFFKVGLGNHFKLNYTVKDMFDLGLSQTPKSILSYLSNKLPLELPFVGNVVIISGANTEPGQYIARLLVESGASVVLRHTGSIESQNATLQQDLSHNSIELNNSELYERIKRLSLGEVCFVGEASCSDTISRAISQFGRIDAIINCITSTEYDHINWHQHCRHHLDVAYLLSKKAWPYFKHQKFGRIINVMAIQNYHAFYEPLKYGLIGMTSSLTAEGQQFNASANIIINTSNNLSHLALIACLSIHRNAPFQGATLSLDEHKLNILDLIQSQGLDLHNKLPTWDYQEALQKNWDDLTKFSNPTVNNQPLKTLLKSYKN